MPIVRSLLLCLMLVSPCSLAAERLSLRIAGGHTEFEGIVDHDAHVIAVLRNPFDPDEIQVHEFDTFLPVRYRDDDVSWEATLSYRVWRNLSITGGYVDLGRFDSDPMLVGLGAAIVPPLFRGRVAGPIFGPVRPLDPPPFTDLPLNPPPFAGIAPISSVASLDADAWLLGLELDHDVNDRLGIYLRASALRASFELESAFPPAFELHEPSNRTGWHWSVGAEYAVLPRTAIGVAFSQYDVDLMKLDSYQLTVSFDLL